MNTLIMTSRPLDGREPYEWMMDVDQVAKDHPLWRVMAGQAVVTYWFLKGAALTSARAAADPTLASKYEGEFNGYQYSAVLILEYAGWTYEDATAITNAWVAYHLADMYEITYQPL